MSSVLVIGAGLAGCVAAARLSEAGTRVVMVEKTPDIGGKVRGYGCKATDKCNNCGLCLACGLWNNIRKNRLVEVITSAEVVDLLGEAGEYTAVVRTSGGLRRIGDISSVIVSAGFDASNAGKSAHLHIEKTKGVLLGSEMEALIRGRSKKGIFPERPGSVAFIQCFGSRDAKERSFYCSRVCCAYSTRAARVIKQHYPACEITFFYMELQSAANSDIFEELTKIGVRFVKCRPVRITGERPVAVEYDDLAKGMTRENFDMVILSEGIRPSWDNSWMSAAYGLEQDEFGFLHKTEGCENGVYAAGCARRPLTIEETCADAETAADAILTRWAEPRGLTA
ncbi:MAG: NAD(P)-binding protein [Synergistaceae bacterium]|jgi:heterodisulfide reductase subunit A|nr:NAD(P)-binding protein [Synergistaceae bacterium]